MPIASRFVKSATRSDHYPDLKLPEIAVYGRSNSGKSSLINLLAKRKDLVKTGQKPGMTREINFFVLEEKYSLADLPGFGYAELPEPIRKRFKPMIMEYFERRAELKLVLLLLDIRRQPSDGEFDVLEALDRLEIPTALVATKADKVTGNDRVKLVKAMSQSYGLETSDLFVTSSKSGVGMKELWSAIREQCSK